MKKLTFIAVLLMVIGICFTASAFAADFYVIPVKTSYMFKLVPKTGQTSCWDFGTGETIDCVGTGQDGEYQLGITPAMAPSDSSPYTVPNWEGDRFTDNNDGTVNDNLTGLIWLKNVDCFSAYPLEDAFGFCNSLANGLCGLTDGSTAGDWRLPNFNELRSLVDPSGETDPILPNGHPFTNVPPPSAHYWSSTSVEPGGFDTWTVSIYDGTVKTSSKYMNYHTWPVRGGN